MDPSVIRAMARWPDVPAVYGWMSLDRRGRWRLQGEPILHRGVIEFVNRNYDCAGDGRWYFQNGPQRVFLDLDYTPWVYSLDGSMSLVDHAGAAVALLHGAWLDEEGSLLLLGERGIGLVCDRDLGPLSECLRFADGAVCDDESIARLAEGGEDDEARAIFLAWGRQRFKVESIPRRRVAATFGFDPRPREGVYDD